MRRHYGDAAAHHSTHNTQDHTCHHHQQLAHQHSNTPQNQSRTNRSIQEGGDGVVRGACSQNARLTGCGSHRFRAGGTAQPETFGPERTEEREAEPAGGRAALDRVTVTLRYAHAKKIATHTYM